MVCSLLPADVYRPSNLRALSTLFRALFLAVLGCYVVTVSNSYLWPIGALVSGCAMSYLYSVGYDCAQRSFFRWRWANHLVGVLCTLLMLRPFTSLRLPRADERSAFAARMKRIASCFSVKELKALYAEGDWRRSAMPIIDLSAVLLFAAVFIPLMLYFLGVGGLIKYWLFPFVDMHVRIGTFTSSVLSRVPYLALFHPEVSHMMVPNEVQKMMRFPSYNVAKAHAHISQSVTAAKQAVTPSFAVLRKITAPIDSLAFGRLSRDTPAIAYAVCTLFVSFLLYKSTMTCLMLVPTCMYLVGAMLFRKPVIVESSKKIDGEVKTQARTKTVIGHATHPHMFNRIFLGTMHGLGVLGLVYMYYYFNLTTLVFAFLLYHFAAMGITAGAHRFYAHRTYNGTPAMSCMLMIMNLFAAQGSIYKWVRDHRLHHKHVDTEKDPHNSERGFWWSHCGWLFYAKSQEVVEAGKHVYMDDLDQDPFVVWQSKNNNWASPLCAFGVPTLIAWTWGDAIGGYFVAGVLRYICTLHFTWFVNSIAHLWGSRPYIPTINPRENLFVALCADGEGWHNYHHAYPYDYSANEHGVFQYNPTTLFINLCAKLGLVTDRRRATLPKPGQEVDVSTLPKMTMSELSTLGKQQSCILAIDGIVYDLTTFEDNHPAGASILKDQYGKDATKAFHGEIHAHTDVAINLMQAYAVARLA